MARRKTIAKTWKDKHHLTQIPFTYIISPKTPKPFQNPTSRLPSVKQNENFERVSKPKITYPSSLPFKTQNFEICRFIPGSPEPSALVREGLVRRARDFNIVLDDVAITHLSYGPEFSKAVEAKQGAQQVAERSKFVVAKADRVGETAAVIRAEAARLISEATKGAAVIRADRLRRIEAWREITATLAKNPNVTYLPGDEGNRILWGLVVGESVISLILMLFGSGSVLVKFMNGGN